MREPDSPSLAARLTEAVLRCHVIERPGAHKALTWPQVKARLIAALQPVLEEEEDRRLSAAAAEAAVRAPGAVGSELHEAASRAATYGERARRAEAELSRLRAELRTFARAVRVANARPHDPASDLAAEGELLQSLGRLLSLVDRK